MKKDTRKNMKKMEKMDALYLKIQELQRQFVAQVNPTEDEREERDAIAELFGLNEGADEFPAAADIYYRLRDPECDWGPCRHHSIAWPGAELQNGRY
jgi:hypothetical protein